MAYDPWVQTPAKPKTNRPLVRGPWQTAPSGFGAAPPAPPGSPPGGGGGGGFDYQSNPYYQQVLAAVNAGGLADAASTRAAIQQALIGFGFVPGGFKDKMGALDATTRALIEKNTQTGISGYARLLEGRTEGIKDLVNRLQARGLRRSGAKGYGLRKNQLGYDRNFADAVANLLGMTGGAYSQYAQNEAARQNQLAQAMAWVYQNYFVPTGGGTPANTYTYTPYSARANPSTSSLYDRSGTYEDPYSGGGGGVPLRSQ